MKAISLKATKIKILSTTVVALSALLIVACSTAAPTEAPPTAAPQATEPAATLAPGETPTPTPLPVVQPTARPTDVVVARDDITIVINEEPSIPDPWLSTTLYPNQIIQNIAQPFSLFGPDFTDTVTGGFTGFEQTEPNTWRLFLREGVTFHNGEEWNAEAAAWTIDTLGGSVEFQPFSQVRESHAEIIDPLTVDFVCESSCPVLPRFGQYHIFRAPADYQNKTQEERDETGEVIGWGPYKWVEWNRGIDIRLEAHEGYVEPQPVNFMTQAPSITDVTYVFREEELVRAAMIQTGEAHVAWAMAIDHADAINNSDHGKTVKIVSGEVYTLNVDTIWHPELRKLKVRQAMTHAIDCEELALALFGPESRCSSGANGIPGTLGVNEENWKPIYKYDPVKVKQLLEEADYNPDNVIEYWTRAGRYAKDVELAESLATFWQDAGINVDVKIVEGSIWRDRHLTGPAEAYDAALKDGATPEEAAEAVHASDPPAPSFGSPGLIAFAPGGEYFDFGRQINFYMSCEANRSKNCQADWHDLGQRAIAASGDERRQLMEEAYGVFSENVLQIPLMEIVSVWGVNKDLDYVNMPGGRRILVNTINWIQ